MTNSADSSALGAPSIPARRAVRAIYRDGQLVLMEPLDLPNGVPIGMQLAVLVMSDSARRSEPDAQPASPIQAEIIQVVCQDGTVRLLSPLSLAEDTPVRLSLMWQLSLLATVETASQSTDPHTVSEPGPPFAASLAGRQPNPDPAQAAHNQLDSSTIAQPPADEAPANGAAARLPWNSFASAALALILVYAGQALLLSTEQGSPAEGLIQTLAGSLLIAGALLFGALVRQTMHILPRLEFPHLRRPASFRYNWWPLGWLGCAVILMIGAIGLFATRGETWVVLLAWLASIVALLVGQLSGTRPTRPRVTQPERPYLVGLAVLLGIALITRVYKLATLPYNVDGDFASVGLVARALVSGEKQQIFAYDGWAGVPILGYLPPWLTMKLFGDGLTGLNASGVIEGLCIIVGVYLLGRDLFHPRVGLFAAALLTISYTHLAASRQSSYIDPVVFLVFSIYFLLVGLCEGRGWAIVISGALAALCVQMYFSGRIVIFIVGFIVLYLLLFHRAWLWAHWWAVPLWVLAVGITLGPMLVVFIRDSDQLMARTREVFILDPAVVKHQQGVYGVVTLSGMLMQQARHTLLMFHYYPDTGTQFDLSRPFLDPYTAPIFTLGIGCALVRWRRFGNALMLAWIGLGLLIGCFLTVNPPFWPRLMILLPATALVSGLALDRLYQLARHGLKRVGKRAAQLVPVTFIVVLLAVGGLNWNTYLTSKGTPATPRTRIARYLTEQPASTRAYLVSAEYRHDDREFEFLAPGRLVADLTPEQVQAESAAVDTPALVILTPEQVGLVQLLQQRFPGEAAETHNGDTPDDVAFYVFRLP